MSGYNLPDGCIDSSDQDYYNRVNGQEPEPEESCPDCGLPESDCECLSDLREDDYEPGDPDNPFYEPEDSDVNF
jgi:hypothetical protein